MANSRQSKMSRSTATAWPKVQSVVTMVVLILTICGVSRSGWGADYPDLSAAAAKAHTTTVTLRVVSAGSAQRRPARSPQVTVFSGVSLGDGLIVTPLFVTENVQVRLTLPGGEQAIAQPRLLDEHSGLALLKIDRSLEAIELAEQKPRAGSWVVSAAAWGTELPLVSVGILGGVDRRMPGTTYPPLLQCNLTQAETSSGAPVLNPRGELIGIVVAAENSKTNIGWMYAVPIEHVRRLLRVHQDQPVSQSDEEQIVVLKRRRPIVGMDIGGELDHVFIKRIMKDGPAQRAGLKAGDRILAVDGVQIRSPYQAVTPTIFKQPGDIVRFLVNRGDGSEKSCVVVLGGGVALPVQQATSSKLNHLIEPKVVVNSVTLRRALNNRSSGTLSEVFGRGGPEPAAGRSAPRGTPESTREANKEQTDGKSSSAADAVPARLTRQIDLLQKAIERYQSVIDLQRRQMTEQQQEIEQARRQINQLESEFSALKKAIQDK